MNEQWFSNLGIMTLTRDQEMMNTLGKERHISAAQNYVYLFRFSSNNFITGQFYLIKPSSSKTRENCSSIKMVTTGERVVVSRHGFITGHL